MVGGSDCVGRCVHVTTLLLFEGSWRITWDVCGTSCHYSAQKAFTPLCSITLRDLFTLLGPDDSLGGHFHGEILFTATTICFCWTLFVFSIQVHFECLYQRR